MTEPVRTHVDARHASVGQMVIAERVFFGGQMPADTECDALREWLGSRFAASIERGAVASGDAVRVNEALHRLFGGRGRWVDSPAGALASLEVDADSLGDLRLPLELLRAPEGAGRVVVRCEVVGTHTVAEAPRPHPEASRLVLATSSAAGPVPADAVLEAVEQTCRVGLHRCSGSHHDRKRGAFNPALDHLPSPTLLELQCALRAQDGRPAAAVLLVVCHVREGGLCFHDGDGEAVIDTESFAAALEAHAPHLRLVVLLPVADASAVGDVGRVLVDVATALHRRGLAAVVAPRMPLPPAALAEVTRGLLGSLLGDARIAPSSLEVALARVGEVLAGYGGLAHLGLRLHARAADGDDTRPFAIRPYRGLLSFEPEHERFYVGRREEAEGVVERLAELGRQGRPRLVLLVGASGVGKSSLAKAGVVPKLTKGKDAWTAIHTRPAEHSLVQLEAMLGDASAGRRLVVVDQLEEVFTEATVQEEAAAYLQRLWALAAEDDTAVVATLRIDALNLGGEVRVDDQGGPTLEQLVPGPHAIFVHHLQAEALREVIDSPARGVGLVFDEGLVDRLCTEALAEPGALPMLELALDLLWHQRQGRALVANAYEGGLASMLAAYATACVEGLPEEQRAQAERILVRAATGPTVELATWRRRSTVDALRPQRPKRREAFDHALAALVEARLVVLGDVRAAGGLLSGQPPEASTAAVSVELAHELLLRRWDALRSWIDEAAPRLPAIRDLERWVQEFDTRETLLTDEQLAYVEQATLWADDDLNGSMLTLLDASRAASRKRKRLRRRLFVGVGVAAIAFAGLSYWALGQRDEAREQTELAEEQTELAVQKTEQATTQSQLAQRRLSEANELASMLIYDLLPELERYPQVRLVRKQMLEKLQQMQRKLGVTDTDIEARWNAGTAHGRRGDEAMLSDNVPFARREYEAAHRVAEGLVASFPYSPQAQRYLSVSLNKLGNVEVAAGNLAVAREHYARSLQVTQELAAGDPDSAQAQRDLSISLEKLGNVEVAAGNLAGAREHYARSLQARQELAAGDPDSAQAQRDLSVSLNKLGDVEVAAGNLAGAREHYARSLQARQELAAGDPDSAQAQRDLSVSLNKLGDVEVAAGNLAGAREHYARSLQVTQELAAGDPDSAQAQRDLSISLEKLGNVEVAAGNLAGAREHYARSLQVTQELAAGDPDSAQAQRDLSVSLNKLGDVEVAAGNLAGAREHYARSLQVTQELAAGDPDSAQAQRDLSISLEKLGNVEVVAGNLAGAREHYARSLQARQELAAGDPDSAQAQRDLSISLEKLGNVEVAAGNLAGARAHYARSLQARQELAAGDPDSAQVQRDLSVSLNKLGDVEVAAGNLAGAREHYARSSQILEQLAAGDPDSAQAHRDLSVSLERLGDVEAPMGNLAGAREHYARSLQVTQKLAAGDPDSAQAQRDLSVSLERLGDVEVEAGNLVGAREHYARSLQVAQELAAGDPDSAQAQRDLSISLDRLGNVEVAAGNLTRAREHYSRSLETRQELAAGDPDSAQASFDVVLSLARFMMLAESDGDLLKLTKIITAINERIAAMDAKGQIDGFAQREAVRRILQEKARLLDGGP